eukprot:scpid21103/ scgid20454/ 
MHEAAELRFCFHGALEPWILNSERKNISTLSGCVTGCINNTNGPLEKHINSINSMPTRTHSRIVADSDLLDVQVFLHGTDGHLLSMEDPSGKSCITAGCSKDL